MSSHLVSGSVVNLGGETLSFSVASKEVFSLVQTETENLPIQIVVLVPQFMVFLSGMGAESFFLKIQGVG